MELVLLIIVGVVIGIIKLVRFAGTGTFKDKNSVPTGKKALKNKRGSNVRVVYDDRPDNDAPTRTFASDEELSDDEKRRSGLPYKEGEPVPSGGRRVFCPACGAANLVSIYDTCDSYYCHACHGKMYESVNTAAGK